MPQPLKLFLKSTIFEKEKVLIIDPEFLEYDGMNFSKFEIAEVCYGIKAIKGYRFRIGRIYCIDIKSLNGNIIKLRLKSLYRIRIKKLTEKYKIILNALFKNYINDISLTYIKMFNDKIDFSVLGVIFSQAGIQLDKKSDIISWLDLGTKKYNTYYSLFSNSDSKKYKLFYYLSDWNTVVLYSVSRSILKAKQLL